MASDKARTLRTFLGFAVAVTIGFSPSRVVAAPVHVKVGPNPCDLISNGVVTSNQSLHRGQDSIDWDTNSSNKLHLVFHIPSMCTSPFPGAIQNTGLKDASGNNLWVLGNGGGPSPSGPLTVPPNYSCFCDPATSPCDTIQQPPLKGQIKYDQIFKIPSYPPVACDGWIIIK
jgi:hypothetical protein